MNGLGFIIGTLAIMFASQVISVPLARKVLQSRGGNPSTVFMGVDVTVMAVIGLCLGFFMHTPFIGISLSPKGWPGMIAFIASSYLGSMLGVRI